MKMDLIFWVLMLFWAVFGIIPDPPAGQPVPIYRRYGGTLLLFILLFLLGWAEFGPAVKR